MTLEMHYQEQYEQGYEHGIEHGIEQGLEKGIERGTKKGELQRAKQTALRMIRAEKFSLDEVALYTALTQEQVLELMEEV